MPTLAELKAQKLKVEVERQTIMNNIIKSTLVKMEDVDAVIAEVQATIKTKLLGYPARVVPFIIGKEDPDEMIRILTKHLYEALSELKGADSEAIKARDKRKQVYFGTKEKMMKK